MSKKAKAEEATDTALSVPEPGELEPFDLLGRAAQLAGAGTEKIGMKEQSIPTLRILQSNSHECTEGDPKFVEGARSGNLFAITPDGPRVFDGQKGLVAYVAHFDKVWIEWVPIVKGGGFVARHPTEETGLQLRRDKDNEITETWEYYLIVEDPDNPTDFFPVLFGCSKSKLTPARMWNNVLKGLREKDPTSGKLFVPPSWYSSFLITTKGVTNKQGQPYKNFEPHKGEKISSNLKFQACEELRRAVMGGLLATWQDVDTDAVIAEEEPAPAGEPTY